MSTLPRSEALDLRGRRIFITGGTGFLGRSLLDYLQEGFDLHGGVQVTVLSRSPGRFIQAHPQYADQPWLSFVSGDLARLPAVELGTCTDLIHAAADTHSQADSLAWIDQLVNGTRNVLEFARSAGVRRMLFISSGAIYGAQPQDVAALREDHSFAPPTTDIRSAYAQGKRMAEHLCAQFAAANGLECVIARCFAIVSRHIPLDGPYAMGNFLRDALAAQGIQISGSGKTVRSYIDGRDMAHWMLTLLSRGKSGEAYNVGSDQPVSTLELATAIREVVGIVQAIHISGQPDSSTRSVYLPSIRKARELGLRIETSLQDALAQGVQALRKAGRPRNAESTPTS